MISNPISKTSLLTAAMRAVETEAGEDQLFNDPYAKYFAGEEGFRLRDEGTRASGYNPAIAVRTAYFDQKILESVQEGYLQIVLLAAGMDSRAYRLQLKTNITIFELDRPEVFAYKKKMVEMASKEGGLSANPKCNLRTISTNLTEEWAAQLIQSGFNPTQKTLWVIEGLLMYLTENQIDFLFHQINSISSAEDRIILDCVNRSMLDSPYTKAQIDFLAELGAPWLFGTNEPEIFFSGLGWNANVIQPAEYNSKRWPRPLVPRNIEGVPRGFYIDADPILKKK